jgi:hypothetical protein
MSCAIVPDGLWCECQMWDADGRVRTVLQCVFMCDVCPSRKCHRAQANGRDKQGACARVWRKLRPAQSSAVIVLASRTTK